MSLFGGFMRDFEDDPFFGASMSSMQHMNSMMNSMLADPFSMFGGGMFGGRQPPPHAGALMPFGFPNMNMNMPMNMNNIFENFQMNPNDPNCHSYSSSTVMTMSNGPDGRPQVYQASQSTRTAPGGIKETKKSVSDSRTGTKKLAIGHHIGERAHVIEREQNVSDGQLEERQEFINLEEEEADDFNREWERKATTPLNAIGYGRNHSRRYRDELPAITDRSRNRPRPTARRLLALPSSTSSSEPTTTERAKKRIHEEHIISSDEDEEETAKKSQKTVKSSSSRSKKN